jgi:alpha-ketoglutaric semialdehyde dehydrogenase
MKTLLLLVDFQQEFLKRPQLQPCAGETVFHAESLLNHWRRSKQPVAHLLMSPPTTPADGLAHRRDRITVADDGESPGGLRPMEGESIIHKTGFSAPELVEKVTATGAKRVVIAGLMLHACVREAALQLYQSGMEVVLAGEAVASDDPVHAAITKRYFEDRSLRFSSTASLIESVATGIFPTGRHEPETSVNESLEIAASVAVAWEETPYEERAALIDRLADILQTKIDQVADCIHTEIRKPLRFSYAEVLSSAEMAAGLTRRLRPSPDRPGKTGVEIRRRPHGVVAIITPWNNPVYLPLGKILPAILCGNTVVWKPAREANGTARVLHSLIEEAGLPRGVVNLCRGDAETGRELISHSCIDAVSLTGSDSAGFSASEICAKRRIPFQAELGGNNAAIVLADADLTFAASSIAAGAFEMAGQRCTANRRVIVERSCLNEFLEKLQQTTANLDPSETVGSLVDESHHARVSEAVQRAVAAGMPIFHPLPEGPGSPPLCFPPTILICEDPSHEIVQEETFGPVLVLQPADSVADAISKCNGVRQGLAASIFSEDENAIATFLRTARAGILKINASTAGAVVDVAFGGWKSSGIGPPEHGEFDLEFYSRPQTLYR